MNRVFLVVTSVFIMLTISVKSQEQLLIAKIKVGTEAIDFAYIKNDRTNYAVESNHGGLIKISAQENDTLQFHCLGYKDTSFVVTATMLESENYILEVQKQEYALDEVKVVWFYSYAAFKQAFANIKLDDKDKPMKFDVKISQHDLAVNHYFAPSSSGVGFAFNGVLSGGSDYLTEGQQFDRHIKHYNNKWGRYNQLTSHENLSAFTGLEGDSLESFVYYLRTKHKINPDLDDYEILASVKVAYKTFLALNTSQIDSVDFDNIR